MKALRRLWLNVHLWLGLILLIPIAILGVTGTALTFQEEIERALMPARYAVTHGEAQPAAILVDHARAALGSDFAVTSVTFPETAADPFIVNARAKGRQEGAPPQSRRVWLDPASGRVLDIANPRGGAFGVMHQLHGQLMIPEIGRKVVGWMGWSLLISSLTGLWLWWPRGALLRAFRWEQRPLFSFNFHHFVGFWVSIPLAILAATGIYVSFPQSARSFTQFVMHAAAPQQQERGERGESRREGSPRGGGAPLDHTTLSLDDVARIARAAAPGGALVGITLPTRPRGDGAPRWRADMREGGRTAQYNINDEAGAEARASRGGGGNNQDPAALLMRHVHDGRGQSLWWRAIIAVSGLLPLLLGLTGLLWWLWRNRAKARGEDIQPV